MDCFLHFERMGQRQTGGLIKLFKVTKGGEYLSEGLQEYLSGFGTVQELTLPYFPHQNSVAERMNRTILSLVRPILRQSHIPNGLSAEALCTANLVEKSCNY